MTTFRYIASVWMMLSTLAVATAQQSGTWSVSSADKVDIIAASVNMDVTYRIHVDQNQGDVEVIVRNANGDKVNDRSGKVEGGDSRDFDLDQGWSIEVRYASASSTGTYQRL